MELELWVADADRTPPKVEPCERCGTPVQVLDTTALVRLLCGLPETDPHPEWVEVRTTSTPGWPGSLTLQTRPHTPRLCDRARAGDPEPWADPTISPDDDEDDG